MTKHAFGSCHAAMGYTIAVILACSGLSACDQKSEKTQAERPTSASAQAPAVNASRPAVKYSTVRAEGSGKTFDDALQNALILAVQEVNGSRVSKSVNSQSLVSDYHSQASSSGQYSASDNEKSQANVAVDAQGTGDGQSASVHETANANAEADSNASGKFSGAQSDAGSFDANSSIVNSSSSTSGVVRRFQVAAKRQDQGLWYVTIVAEIPVYVASAASKRLKIAVLPFRLAADDKSSQGFEQSVRSQVIDALTQSGKVAVLDRDYTQENQDALSQLQDESFSKDEAAKLGNRLGADYIIVGTVSKAAATRESMYMQAVGRTVYGATHADAQLTFRLIEAATGVVQLSGTLAGSKYAASSLDVVAKAEAADLVTRILESLYPLRIESIADGVFYLGRGGDSIHVGDEFRVLKQGEPIVDSDTHEILGYSEKEIGNVVVTEVEQKLSKAKLADGTSAQVTDATNLIARPVESSATAQTSAAEPGASPGQAAAAAKPKHKAAHHSDGAGVKAGTDY